MKLTKEAEVLLALDGMYRGQTSETPVSHKRCGREDGTCEGDLYVIVSGTNRKRFGISCEYHLQEKFNEGWKLYQ